MDSLSEAEDTAEVTAAPRRVLIIVENLPVPLDRRVWAEATSLARAGYTVSVICPRTADYPAAYEFRDGVHIYRHPLPFEARGVAGFVLEYLAALFGELRLAWRVRREHGFDVIQLCNPPDLLFLVGLAFRWLDGCRLVFDHHDPVPELFALRFPKWRLLLGAVKAAERLTFRFADQVIASSEALRGIALGRGKKAPSGVHLVRSGIALDRFAVPEPDPALRAGGRHLVAYLGIIGAQDGGDVLLDAVRHIRFDLGREDIRYLVIGDGPMLPALRRQATETGISDIVTFTGYVVGERLFRLLASADIGVCPDPRNAFNDALSMNKILEYMAFGLGVAMFPLKEGAAMAGPAGEMADGADAPALARAILRLLDDEERRRTLRMTARRRVAESFSWAQNEKVYLRVYDLLFPESQALGMRSGGKVSGRRSLGLVVPHVVGGDRDRVGAVERADLDFERRMP